MWYKLPPVHSSITRTLSRQVICERTQPGQIIQAGFSTVVSGTSYQHHRLLLLLCYYNILGWQSSLPPVNSWRSNLCKEPTSSSIWSSLTMFSWSSLCRTSNSLICTSRGRMWLIWLKVFTAYSSPVCCPIHNESKLNIRVHMTEAAMITKRKDLCIHISTFADLVPGFVHSSCGTLPHDVIQGPDVVLCAMQLHHGRRLLLCFRLPSVCVSGFVDLCNSALLHPDSTQRVNGFSTTGLNARLMLGSVFKENKQFGDQNRQVWPSTCNVRVFTKTGNILVCSYYVINRHDAWKTPWSVGTHMWNCIFCCSPF